MNAQDLATHMVRKWAHLIRLANGHTDTYDAFSNGVLYVVECLVSEAFMFTTDEARYYMRTVAAGDVI